MRIRCLICKLTGADKPAEADAKKQRRKLPKVKRLNIPGSVRVDAGQPILPQLARLV